MPELLQAVEDVAATIPTEMLWDAVQNLCKRAQAFLEASGGYLKHIVRPIQKNDDPKLFSPIFEFKIQ